MAEEIKKKKKNTNRYSLTLSDAKTYFNSSDYQIELYEYSRTEEKYRKKYKKSRDLSYAKKKNKFQTCYLRNELNKILDIYHKYQVSKTFLPFVC